MSKVPFIPITKPDLGEEEAEAARSAVLSGWVTQGPEVAAFEAEFATAVGSPHACAVTSGTSALHLALLSVGVGPGDEVITVSHSFIATANAVRHCGATPIFVDIEPDTYNMDPAQLAAALTKNTRAILCVHQMGMPCDLTSILTFARAHHLFLVEDAACAVGSALLGGDGRLQPIGQPHGDAACFSFHPRKVVTTGDGGMITVRSPELDQRLRLWRQHGMSIPDTVRHLSSEVMFESYPVPGFNYRMTDIQAAVGRPQLRRLNALVARRREIAGRYHALLGEIPGIGIPAERNWARSNWQSYCVRLPDGVNQRSFMQCMLDQGIATRRGIMCAHRESAYGNLALRHELPHSEAAQDHCVLLPIFPTMVEADISRVTEVFHNACRSARGRA